MRGDVHHLKHNRTAEGREQKGLRFAVILQSDDLPLSTVVMAPTSTSARPATWRPAITIKGTITRVMVEQLSAVDTGRIGKQVRSLSHDELHDVEEALYIVLGL